MGDAVRYMAVFLCANQFDEIGLYSLYKPEAPSVLKGIICYIPIVYIDKPKNRKPYYADSSCLRM